MEEKKTMRKLTVTQDFEGDDIPDDDDMITDTMIADVNLIHPSYLFY